MILDIPSADMPDQQKKCFDRLKGAFLLIQSQVYVTDYQDGEEGIGGDKLENAASNAKPKWAAFLR